ncbi:MAG: N-acetyltransferase family protein [Gemmatimonadaceae bacterium]
MLTIRLAVVSDLPAIGRLGALLVRLHHEMDPRRFIAATPETPEGYARFLASQLEAPDALLMVAENDGAVIGYSYSGMEGQDWMTLRGPAGVVHDLVVAAEARNAGIGRALLDATIAELERRGAPQMVLSAAARNEAAQRLFARAGFRPTMVEMTRERGGGAVA